MYIGCMGKRVLGRANCVGGCWTRFGCKGGTRGHGVPVVLVVILWWMRKSEMRVVDMVVDVVLVLAIV